MRRRRTIAHIKAPLLSRNLNSPFVSLYQLLSCSAPHIPHVPYVREGSQVHAFLQFTPPRAVDLYRERHRERVMNLWVVPAEDASAIHLHLLALLLLAAHSQSLELNVKVSAELFHTDRWGQMETVLEDLSTELLIAEG